MYSNKVGNKYYNTNKRTIIWKKLSFSGGLVLAYIKNIKRETCLMRRFYNHGIHSFKLDFFMLNRCNALS